MQICLALKMHRADLLNDPRASLTLESSRGWSLRPQVLRLQDKSNHSK